MKNLFALALLAVVACGGAYVYGYHKADTQLRTTGVSVFSAGITALSLNPISRKGYVTRIQQDTAVMQNVNSILGH